MYRSETTTTIELTRNEIYDLAKDLSLRIAEIEQHGHTQGDDSGTGSRAVLLEKLLAAHARLTVETWTSTTYEPDQHHVVDHVQRAEIQPR